MCHLSGICFRGELPEKNCRSCKHAYPGKDATWICNLPIEPIGEGADVVLSRETIAVGCDHWKPIING
jgi:hypothetical protein